MGGGCAIDIYSRVIRYGVLKTEQPIWVTFLQAICAGLHIGIAAHACTNLAGSWETIPKLNGVSTLVYAVVFPVAFSTILWTGGELFTGNVMTMVIGMWARQVTLLQTLLNWGLSLLGNLLGTLLVACMLTAPSGVFAVGNPSTAYLDALCEYKTHLAWHEAFVRGIGCNILVCLGMWMSLAAKEASGKAIAVWFPVACFAIAGFEHSIANSWTLSAGLILQVPSISFKGALWQNLIPVTLGNFVGGGIFVGFVYGLCFGGTHIAACAHPNVSSNHANTTSMSPDTEQLPTTTEYPPSRTS